MALRGNRWSAWRFRPEVKTYPDLACIDCSVGTAQTTVAHNLPYVPHVVIPVLWLEATLCDIGVSAVPDATNVYLIAETAATSVRVFVQ